MGKMKRSLFRMLEIGKSNIFGHIAVPCRRKIWQIILHIVTTHMVSTACNGLHDYTVAVFIVSLIKSHNLVGTSDEYWPTKDSFFQN